MNKIEFKNNSSRDNINLKKDTFYNKVVQIISFNKNNIKVKGSYIKYGKEKSCDIDFDENINNDMYISLRLYINKLYENIKEIQHCDCYLDIIDERIKKTLQSIGGCNSLLEINNYNLKIDNDLPNDIKLKIQELGNIYNDTKNISDYFILYNYLLKLLSPHWNLEELKKGEKYHIDKIVNLYNSSFTFMQVNIIVDKFSVSCTLKFNNIKIMNKNIMSIRLASIIYNNKINYYNVIKKFQVFLKWAYYNKKFKDHDLAINAIKLYNIIYDFREKIGDINYKFCTYNNYLKILTNKNKINKVEKKIKKYFRELNEKSKTLFTEQSIKYKKYLLEYMNYNA